jgi:hypothetical protein
MPRQEKNSHSSHLCASGLTSTTNWSQTWRYFVQDRRSTSGQHQGCRVRNILSSCPLTRLPDRSVGKYSTDGTRQAWIKGPRARSWERIRVGRRKTRIVRFTRRYFRSRRFGKRLLRPAGPGPQLYRRFSSSAFTPRVV